MRWEGSVPPHDRIDRLSRRIPRVRPPVDPVAEAARRAEDERQVGLIGWTALLRSRGELGADAWLPGIDDENRRVLGAALPQIAAMLTGLLGSGESAFPDVTVGE